MLHIYISKIGHNQFRQWHVACLVLCHSLKESWPIVDWTLRTNFFEHGSHKNLRKKFHDFSMTSPGQNPNFQTKNTNICFLRPMYQIVESIVWNLILKLDINPDTSEAVSIKTIKKSITHILFNGNFRILARIRTKLVPLWPIGIKATLVQLMAWCRTGHKPLPEHILSKILDCIWHH